MNSSVIRIAIVEDQNLIRKNLRKIIDMEENCQVIFDVSTPIEALEILDEGVQVDILLVDWELYDKRARFENPNLMNGMDLAKKILREYREAKVILITGQDYDEVGHIIKKALEVGVQGFLLKECGEEDVFSAIKEVNRGSFYYRGEVMDLYARYKAVEREIDISDSPALSPEELRVLAYVADGKSNKIIAEIEGCGIGTVENRRGRIREKLHAENLYHALAKAYKCGILSLYD